MRNIYILGLTLFLGISIPQYFVMNTDNAGHGPVKTHGGWVRPVKTKGSFICTYFYGNDYVLICSLQFNDILNTIFSSSPTVALIVGTLLDNTLEARRIEERGLPWLIPFHRRKGDSRNEEFYSYPLRISEYIPTRFL